MAAPSAGDISAALLDPDSWWGGSTVTFSVAGLGGAWPGYGADGEPSDPDYGVLGPGQAARFASAAGAWDSVLQLSLVQTLDQVQPGQVRVAFTDVDKFEPGSWGYTIMPPFHGGAPTARSGDIWIDYGKAGAGFAATSYDYMAMIHELGHALGLKHPFEDGATLPAPYDNHRYTVMSYTQYADDQFRTVEPTATGVRTVLTGVFPSTPMVFDVLALQSRYGADTATAAGDTIYSFSQSTPMMQTIWDAGGTDTIDLSSHTRGSVVDLTPGAYSSIAYYSAGAQAAYWTSIYPWAASFFQTQFAQANTYTWSDNLGIAYGTVIENFTGGSGADSVTGNDAANTLLGGGGADSLDGGLGEDYLRGGDGDDRIVGGAGFDDINGNTGNDIAAGGPGDDWVVGGKDNDLLGGDEGDDIVYGNLGADTCDGGVGNDIVRGGQGDDVLTGGAGDDWLSGDRGSDTVTGGAGADVFHSFSGAGIDRVTDFHLAEGDRVLLDPGTAYTVAQAGADTVVDMGGGDQLILAGVSMTSLTGAWIS
ncbi:M10 family metallopeptidase [Phenylobacterium sp.]|jgi:serralysin|uniref:M10 family metallopeptidase n=1 Tax=Phenylobacterium sp. TaxID=1871053 RepID=UPI002F41E4A3